MGVAKMSIFTQNEIAVNEWIKRNRYRFSEKDKKSPVYYITDSWIGQANCERVYLLQVSPPAHKRKIGYYDVYLNQIIILDKTICDEQTNDILETMSISKKRIYENA